MRRGINRLLALVLSFAMVLTGFTFLGGVAVVNADDVDNTILTVKVVDEDGDPVEGVTPLFEAYREKDDFRLYGSDVPTDRPGLDNAGEEFTTNENGIVSFDLNDENTPFITGFGDYEDPVYYNVGLTSEDYEWTAVKLALELQEPDWVESYDYNTVVKSVDGAAYTGQVLLQVTSKDEPVVDLPGISDVYILSANEQPASGGSYKWAFYGEDDTADFSSVSKDDFVIEVKEGDSDWEESDVDFTLDLENEDFTGVVEATIPDNTDAVAKQWRFSYDGGIYDYNDELIDCPAITQAAAEPVVDKPSNVVISRGDGVTEEDQYQPASGGTYIWTVSDSNYGKLEGRIDEKDFKLQTKKVADNEWTDATEGSLKIEIDVDEEFGMDMATITATIPDNEDDYDKDWRIAYIYTEPDTQYESCGAEFYTQMKPEPVAATEITKIDFDKTEYSADEKVTATLTGTGLDALTAADFGLEFDGEGYGDYIAYNYGNIAVTPNEDGTSATVTFNLSAGNKAYRFTAKNYVADSVTNNPQVFKYKAPPAKSFTKVEFNSTEFEATGGTLEATVTGENLDKATAADFGLWVPDPEYGQYGVLNDSGLTATYKASADGLSGTVTFALPANDTESDVEYTFNIVKKPAQYYGGTPTFYSADEVTGAKTVIKVKAPAETEKPALLITADTESIPAAGGDASWGIWGYDGDLDGVVTGEDFVVQKDGVDTDIQAVFTLGNNDDEGTVTITVPANEEATAKTWTLKYDGDFYIQSGEGFKPGECPAITQEAKQTQPEDPAVDAAASAINELPAADAVTAADKEKIEAARAAYDALTDEQKAKVDPEVLKKLEDAEKALKAAEDNATTEDANSQINALPAADKVTTADKEKIEAARAAYDALTDEQKAKVDPEVLKKLEDAEKALAAAQKEEAAKKAEAKAKKVKTVTVNTKTVNAAAIDKAVKKAGGSKKYVTKIVLGKKVKTIKASSFKKYTKVTTLEVKTKKLTKKSIKKALKGSKVKTVKVKIGKKKVNKKFVKKYKKIFTKKIAGKKAKVK